MGSDHCQRRAKLSHMKLVSINIGQREILNSSLYKKPTGIQKRAVPNAQVSSDGVMGDFVVDQKNHGGPDQAVYLYTVPDYDWWTANLETRIAPGTFGENLTISNLESATLCAGDRLQIGALLLEVTAPRIPCSTLAAQMDDAQFVKRFKAAERPGAYCRVIASATVQTGDPVTLENSPFDVTLRELYASHYGSAKLELPQLERLLAAPIAVRMRTVFKARLEQL